MRFLRHAPGQPPAEHSPIRFYFQIVPATILLLTVACLARAEKKIELQDIEEDNLKSENEKDQPPEQRSQTGEPTGRDSLPLEFLKNGLLRYFESAQATQTPRYVHQYAVNEPPEKPVASAKSQYGISSATQQAMVGYLSNVPMQIYLVPQNYGDQNEQGQGSQQGVQYAAPSVARVAGYSTGPEVQVQPQGNYLELPGYVTPQYGQQIAYITYAAPPTATPHHQVTAVVTGPGAPRATVSPFVTYQMPFVQYGAPVTSPTIYTKTFYPNYNQQPDTNAIDEAPENDEERPKQYITQTELPYTKSPSPEFPRYYTSRAPIRDDHRHHQVPELPHPPPILLRSQPSHLAGIPKALPMFRPISKPIYSAPGNLIPSFGPRPNEAYGIPKKRPASLLESYIPSSVQLEYLKRGYSKDPASIYEALSSGRSNFNHPSVNPRYYERGFLPNQMYHTAAGGITYGHYKRTPKLEKTSK